MKSKFLLLSLCLFLLLGLCLFATNNESKAAPDTIFIEAGNSTAIAVKNGTLWMWGSNGGYQLMDETTLNKTEPVEFPDLTGVADIDSGFGHVVMLMDDGKVFGWGKNGNGEAGIPDDENYVHQPTQITIPIAETVVQVACGYMHSLALTDQGTVLSWGSNYNGSLGRGDLAGYLHPDPTVIDGLTNVVAIAAGNHSMALTADGEVYVWGSYTSTHQSGAKEDNNTPIKIDTLTGIVAIAAGGCGNATTFSLALNADGEVFAWGDNLYGQCATGTFNEANILDPAWVETPTKIEGLGVVSSISAGDKFAAAVLADGTLWMWGHNWMGQLGNGFSSYNDGNEYAYSNVPTQVVGLDEIVQVVTGTDYCMALNRSNQIYTWGNNSSGELGDGNGDINGVLSTSPVLLSDLVSETPVDPTPDVTEPTPDVTDPTPDPDVTDPTPDPTPDPDVTDPTPDPEPTPDTSYSGPLQLRCTQGGQEVSQMYLGEAFTLEVAVQSAGGSSGPFEGEITDAYLSVYSNRHEWELYMFYDEWGNVGFSDEKIPVVAGWELFDFEWIPFIEIGVPAGESYYSGEYTFKGHLIPAGTDTSMFEPVQKSMIVINASNPGALEEIPVNPNPDDMPENPEEPIEEPIN